MHSFEPFPDRKSYASVLGPVLNLDGLAQLLHRDRATIKADRCRAPHRVPPAHKPPGTKEPLWLLDEVLQWLRAHPDCSPTPNTSRRIGRPKKAEQVRRARASRIPPSTSEVGM
jgi:hypothetical protein